MQCRGCVLIALSVASSSGAGALVYTVTKDWGWTILAAVVAFFIVLVLLSAVFGQSFIEDDTTYRDL